MIPPILKPIEALRSELLVVSGLATCQPVPTGAGDRAGGTSVF